MKVRRRKKANFYFKYFFLEQSDEFIPSVSTNEFIMNERTTKDNDNEKQS
jgi:hypothetical protein